MVQWRSDNFERKKSRLSLKTHAATLFRKKHTTNDALSFATLPLAPPATLRGFACDSIASLRCRTPLLSPLLLHVPKKEGVGRPTSPWAMKISLHFVCRAGQPDPHFASLSRASLCGTDLLYHPYLKLCIFLFLFFFSLRYVKLLSCKFLIVSYMIEVISVS